MDIIIGDEPPRNDKDDRHPAGPKPFVGMHFKCCGIYCRIYKNKAGNAYEGSCPKCHKKVKLPIGSGGTNHRFFEAE